MKIVNIEGGDAPKHQCQSTQEGDWVHYSCPQCNYTRKVNWKSGEMKISGGSLGTLHSGMHVPAAKQHLMYVPN